MERLDQDRIQQHARSKGLIPEERGSLHPKFKSYLSAGIFNRDKVSEPPARCRTGRCAP